MSGISASIGRDTGELSCSSCPVGTQGQDGRERAGKRALTRQSLLVPWFGALPPLELCKTNVCCLSPAEYGGLLQRPKQTKGKCS